MDFERFTLEEVLAVLDDHSHNTAKWDPNLNGTTDKLLDPPEMDPNKAGLTKEQRDDIVIKRRAVLDRYQWEHDIMVGQRMAVGVLTSRFRDIVKQRRIDHVDAEPWGGLRPCCVDYIAELDRLDVEWAAEPDAETSLDRADYDKLIEGNRVFREQITTGTFVSNGKRQCCPWDDRLADQWLASYRGISNYFNAGGKYEDLRFGPIEVVSDD